MRVERVVYGVPNLDECVRFFTDFGLDPLDGGGTGARFATQTGQVVELRDAGDSSLPPAVQDGPSLREIVWGVDTQESLDKLATGLLADRSIYTDADGVAHTTDETGFGVGLAVSQPVTGQDPLPGQPTGSGNVNRWNEPLSHPGRVRPLRLCHVALDIQKGRQGGGRRVLHRPARLRAHRPGRQGRRVHARPRRHRPPHAAAVPPARQEPGQPLRVRGRPGRRGDRRRQRHDRAAAGTRRSRLGRHTVGSNIFRFIHAPCGGRVEFAADMDRVDENYGPNDYEETPPHTIWTLRLERDAKEGDH